MGYEPYNPSFGVGARVKLVRNRKYPKENLKDLIGTVREDSGSNVSVIFDTIKNVRSSYGAFYFKAVDLVAIDESDEKVKEEENMNPVTNYLNIAKAQFIAENGDGIYEFANFEGDLQEGDLCVVMKPHYGFRLAKVVGIEWRNDLETCREVVAKVHTDDYNTRVDLRNKAAELKAKMEARAKQLQDVALYQMLAKDDADMAALLDEYQGLPKV